MKNILTATDLDNNNKEINRVIEERVIVFNKNRIRKALKNERDLKRIETNDNTLVLTKEESDELKNRLINDDVTKNYIEQEKLNLVTERENYLNLRKNVDGLNQLSWDSIKIEKVGIQNHIEYLTFEDILTKSVSYTDYFKEIKISRLKEINDYIKSISEDKEADLKSLDIIIKLREMYKVTTDTDDFEIFDRFGVDTNVDTSYLLSDIFLSKSNTSLDDNIVNDLMRNVKMGEVSTMNNIRSLVSDNIITNKMLGILFSNKFVTNNEITTYENMYGNNINMTHVYRTRSLGELFLEITNSEASQIEKENRQQIYMTYDGIRPEKFSYSKWNGLQVFDIDLKLWIKKSGGDIDILKEELHKMLLNFHWYLWICKSASGKGLHIYTKVTPAHHVYTNVIDNEKLSKYWHQVSYFQKQSVIYDIMYRLHLINGNGIIFTDFWKDERGVEILYKNDLKQNKYLDNVVSRITAGIRLSYDEKPFINYNFIDAHPGWVMGQTVDGYEYPETINSVFLQEPSNIRRRIDEDIVNEEETKSKYEVDLSQYVSIGGDISNIKPMNKSGINYSVRYNVCNTLAALFGKDGLPIAHMVLDSKGCNNVDEINSFYGCSLTNGKEPSKFGLEILKRSGILKSVDEPLMKEVDTSFKGQIKQQIEKSIENQETLYDIKLGTGYLSDYTDYLLDNISSDKINIILAPPGAGKCLGYGTKVLMFDGSSKEVQDIVVGDLLMGPDSKPRKVLTLARGREEMFKVIPNKGESWTCNKSHIMSLIESGTWKNFQNGNTPESYMIEDMDITKIQNLPKNHRKKLFRVPLNFEKSKVKIEPYWLGLWLGDGNHNDTQIAVGDIDKNHTPKFIESYAKHLGGNMSIYKDNRENKNVSTYAITFDEWQKNPLKDLLREYNLLKNKHIPKEYLLNSREIRLKLFAGIIDSDGGGDKGTYDLVTKLDSLKDDYAFLARSLGYNVNIKKKLVKGKEYWRLLISGDFSDLPVRLERKKFTRKINKNPLVFGFKLESIGVGDYYGFTIDGDKRFLLEDFTVTHNTEFIKRLAKNGKKIMLVLPYVSVIKNKVETDEEISKLFDNYYGSKDLKEMEYGRNIVTTFDKFSRCNYEKVSRMFDYIFIDESHLLFTSSYRIEATSNTIKKLKELFYISSNDPFAAKLGLFTGTETGETFYFKDVGNVINVGKKQLEKELEFLICNDTLDAITRLSDKAAKLLDEGYKLMIPTNKGEIYSEKIIGMIEYLLQRTVKYGYYKRSNTEQEICRLIDEQNSVGDYEIIFCSNYLSVGVDINDKHKFASIYFGSFAGYEIEQFNARIRKTGIKAIYCLPTQTAEGKINELLTSEPNLVLKITDEDKLLFIDDRSIADAKTEFIATYDPVLRKITTPGFSLFNGKIQFNLEEYELISFENKYNECMEHPLKIARELSRYGYTIKVSTEFEGLSVYEQEKLKQMGIESAKNEKMRKHNLLVGTYVDLIKHDTHTNEYGLEFTNVIEWIGKNGDKIIEDRDLLDDLSQPAYVNVTFDVFASPQEVIVRNKEAFDKMFKYARYMAKRYSISRAIDIIYQYVDEQGMLKQKSFQRAVNLLKLIDNSDSNELSEPVSKTIEKIYMFVDKFETYKDYRIGYETYQAIVDSWTHEYIDMLGIKINTKYGWDKIRDALVEMLTDISVRSSSKNGLRFSYNKLPEQDSSDVLSRRSVDNIISSMFNVTESIMTNRQKVREKHIVLQKQEF